MTKARDVEIIAIRRQLPSSAPPSRFRSASKLLACSDVKRVTRTSSKPSRVDAVETRSMTVNATGIAYLLLTHCAKRGLVR